MIPPHGVMNELLLSLSGQPDQGSFWMPPQGATTASEVDWLFYFILAISVVFFVLIVSVMLLFVIRYARRPGRRAERTATSNLPLELTWTVIPLILVIVIFYLGFTGFMRMTIAPGNAYRINVYGQKWKWLFEYPATGYVDEELHVPVNVPVELVMTSQDVIHSFYVPAFRVKRDVVPGRYSKTWFQAQQAGEYTIFCAEYCGTQHSDMISKCVVHEPGGFEAWLEKASNFLETMAPADAGKLLYQKRGCGQCHTVDGTASIGPTLKGLFGHSQALQGGGSVVVDENYIRESILEPQAKIVAGFEGVMPTFRGRVKDPEIAALIEYIRSLSE